MKIIKGASHHVFRKGEFVTIRPSVARSIPNIKLLDLNEAKVYQGQWSGSARVYVAIGAWVTPLNAADLTPRPTYVPGYRVVVHEVPAWLGTIVEENNGFIAVLDDYDNRMYMLPRELLEVL